MDYSKHNILSKLHERNEYFICNLLSGNVDLLSPEESELKNIDTEFLEEKGYVVDEQEEQLVYRNKYLDFLDARDGSEIQIFFVPTYACNFSCSYCYQEGYPAEVESLTKEVIDSFYAYVDTAFAGREKYITLFGGEPLLPGEQYKSLIAYFPKGARERGLDTAIVANGYYLTEYIELLEQGRIREIQVTLDGTEAVHNRRRPTKQGGASFKRIVQGIDAALDAGFPMNIRVVVDKENIYDLPALAEFAREKGWTDNPLVKTQMGRNYELHYCRSKQDHLFTRSELQQTLYDLVKDHPELLEFYRPAFSVSRFLYDNGTLPDPLYDSCPGCKTEWAFDYTGSIYSCTATVGKPGEQLGTFYPHVSLDEDQVERWEERDVTSIAGCAGCPVQLACGGGCAAVAKNNNGDLLTPDCRPVREELELGFSFYFPKKE